MKKRRKVLVALAMAVTMLTPTGISAAEYGQVSGLPNAQEEVQDADGITNDSNELPIVDEKDQDKENPDEPKDNEEKEPIHTGWYQAESGEWYLYDEAGNLKTGWCLQGNTWYYLDGENPEHPGMMTADQIKEINGKYYGFERCLDNAPGEIEIPVKMLVTCARTERPHGALLQLDTGIRYCMYRIGGRRRSIDAS